MIYCKKSTFFCDCAQDGGACNFSAEIDRQQNERAGGDRGLFNFHGSEDRDRGWGGPGDGLSMGGLFGRDGGFARPPDFLGGGGLLGERIEPPSY